MFILTQAGQRGIMAHRPSMEAVAMNKTCSKCGETKSSKEFNRQPRNRDGLTGCCKACAREQRVKYYAEHRECEYAVSKVWREANKERIAANARAWRAANPDKVKVINQRIKEKYPERVKARMAVTHAITAGILVRQPCEVCGATEVHGHHDDYGNPLEVRWLCSEHHTEHHTI